MRSIVFKSTRPAVIAKFTTFALLLLALAACNVGIGTKEDTSIPLEPTNLVAKGVNKGIDINWDKARGATSYIVYYHTASIKDTSDDGVMNKTVTSPKARITGLANGTKYYLRVAAINADGETKLSEEVSATTKATATANLQPPTKLKVTGKDKAIDISWGAVKGAASYTVYYHTAGFDSTTLSVADSKTDITTTTISITGLADGTTYYLRVIASNAIGNSALSQIQSATTKLPAPHPLVSAAASISLAAVDLSWDAVVGTTGYKIYYAKDSLDRLNGGYKNYRAVGGKLETTTDTSITIGDLSADTTYYFVVAANYAGKNGKKEAAAPEVTADSSYIAELAMGGYHGCVRLNTGRIKCWGRNDKGQLGIGDTTHRKTATSVPAMRAKQLSAGGAHSCAIDLEGRLHCWGGNEYLQLGMRDKSTVRIIPTLVKQAKLATKVSLVTAGGTSTCALAGDDNYCWGDQTRGGLGNGVDSLYPTMDAQKINDITPNVKQFALGYLSGCAIDVSDDLWCWGGNWAGQVGDHSKTDRPSPVHPKLQGSSTATMLAGIASHYCVVDDAKKIQCWGENDNGQLGIDSTTDSNIPQYVIASDSTSDHLSGVSKVATGLFHSCALIAGGKVRCWGAGTGVAGRIGVVVVANRQIANTDMQEINNAIDIAAGDVFTCVLLADRARVKCWGWNDYGQLGNGTTSYSSMPVEVQGLR